MVPVSATRFVMSATSQPSPAVSASQTPRKFCEREEFSRSLIGEAERKAALEVIDRAIANRTAFDRYGGVEVDAYEAEFAAHVGVGHATAVSSGTAAVHTALAALNLEPGSEVVCPPITDPGGVGPILFNLCIPVFADTSAESYNVSPEGVRAAITPRTRAILVAHIAGEPCDMDGILAVAAEHNLPVVEDVAQAHDATWGGRPCGSFGALAAFSLMSGKHHTSGGQGGMVVTNDAALCARAKSFADRGKTFGTGQGNILLGLNYRMTELEAGIGRVQLRRLSEMVAIRRARAALLAQRLAESEVFSLGWVPEKGASAYWFVRLRYRQEKYGVEKAEVARRLAERGVPAAPTYTSIIYQQPWFKERNTFGSSGLPWTLPQVQHIPDYKGCCPNAEAALASHLMLACNESVSEDTLNRVADALLDVEVTLRKG